MSSIATELGMVQLCPGASVLRCSEAVFIDKLVLLFLWPFMMAQSWWFTVHLITNHTASKSEPAFNLWGFSSFAVCVLSDEPSLAGHKILWSVARGTYTHVLERKLPKMIHCIRILRRECHRSTKERIWKNLKRNLEYSQKLKFRNAAIFLSVFQWLGLHSIATRVSLH